MQKAKRICLGEGEVVGHKHVLSSEKDIAYLEKSGVISFMLKGLGVLTHDEHDKMVLDKGSYRSYHQVEFNPMDGTVSRVFD